VRIEHLRLDRNRRTARLAAQFIWEDCAHPPCELYFETDAEFGDALSETADAFVAASLTPALWAGERRIAVDEEVCPDLLENLEIVRRLFQHWFNVGSGAARIEAAPRRRAVQRATPGRAAFFLSGGIDSLAALLANRSRVAAGHPLSITDAILVYGLEIEHDQPFGYVRDAMASIANEAGVTLIPVSSNVRALNPDWTFWYTAYMGPALCAVAHALGARIANATIGADYDVPNLAPHGSHPLVEPNFSSHAVRMRYHGLTMSRLDKVRLVASWPPGLAHLRVCNRPEIYEPGRLNCGECEKCVRTMLELLAAGARGWERIFLQHELSSERIERLYAPRKVQPFYAELIGPLADAGRPDLSAAVSRLLASARGETGLTGRLRKFDRERLNGSLVSLKRALTASPVN